MHTVVSLFCFVLEGGSVNGDTSGLLFRGFIDGAIINILGLLLFCQILGDGGGESSLTVIDVTDGADCIKWFLPLT